MAQILRGEKCVFVTPEHINDNMRPTDHAELLSKGLYPLTAEYGTDFIRTALEEALSAICVDALGVFCAHQCFYIQIVNERALASPIAVDRVCLAKALGESFLQQAVALHTLEVRNGDLATDRCYKVVHSGMRILAREDGIDWGIKIPG